MPPDDSPGSIAARNERGADRGAESGKSAPPETTPRLQLITRVGCHLCEDAAGTLEQIAADAGLVTASVDVDADPELQAEYGDRVPVVLLDGREHSYFTVDVPRLRRDLGLG